MALSDCEGAFFAQKKLTKNIHLELRKINNLVSDDYIKIFQVLSLSQTQHSTWQANPFGPFCSRPTLQIFAHDGSIVSVNSFVFRLPKERLSTENLPRPQQLNVCFLQLLALSMNSIVRVNQHTQCPDANREATNKAADLTCNIWAVI